MISEHRRTASRATLGLVLIVTLCGGFTGCSLFPKREGRGFWSWMYKKPKLSDSVQGFLDQPRVGDDY